MVEARTGTYGYWYLVDKSSAFASVVLDGYDGLCFIGDSDTATETQYGFIPFGQKEIMVDADGRKFLIIKDGG